MIRLYALLLTVTFIMTFLTQVFGSCYFSFAQVTKIGSKEMATCEYEGVKFLEGSTLMTTDCFKCECTSNGLSCCGIGIKAGVMVVEDGLKVVQDGCDFKIEREEGADMAWMTSTELPELPEN